MSYTTDTNLKQCLSILTRLIAIPTISVDSNLSIINYIKDLAEPYQKSANAQVNLSYDSNKQKANILISLPDINGSIQGGLMLSGHTDVVPVAGQQWSGDPFTLRQIDGKVYGRGACDMKGFIAACLTMLPEFAANPRQQPVHMAFSYDEEVGCLGARVLITQMQQLGIVPRLTIVGEPTNMELIEGHKGVCEYQVHFHGMAGHASLPHKGVSAVEYAVSYAGRLLRLRPAMQKRAPQDSRFDPPYSTLQVGQLHGGIACNVIADKCSMEWEIRPVQWDDVDFVHNHMDSYVNDDLLPKMRAVHLDADIEKQELGEVVGLQPLEENVALEYLQSLTDKTTAEVVSYGTEAGLFQQMGTSCVICGPGSILQAHKADEFVTLDQLQQCLELLTRIQKNNQL